MMNIVIIGASGFIGKGIYNKCKKRGINVIGTKYLSKDKNLIKFDINNDNIFEIIDVDNIDIKNTFVIVCSAISSIDKCFLDKNYSYKLNVLSTIKLLNTLNKKKLKFIFLSSEAVFDGKKGTYTENDLPNPLTEYGKQKLEVENYILNNLSNNLIFRLSRVIGDTYYKGHIFFEFYNNLVNKQTIYCLKNQSFSTIFVDDVADAIILGFENDLSGLYNLASSEKFSRLELAKQFLLQIDNSIDIIEKDFSEFKFYDNRHLKVYLDSSKFKNQINFEFTPIQIVIDNFWKNVYSINKN